MKKSRMKRWSALVLALLMLLSQIVAVSAEEPGSDDAEYELAVAAIMRDYWNDPEGTVSRLAEIDTVLLGEPKVQLHYVENGNQERATNPTDYKLSVYSYRRGTEEKRRLQWRVDCYAAESRPASLDYVSIEWDTAYASYLSSSGDSTYSSVQAVGRGIVLFNLEDNELLAGTSTVGTVHVMPNTNGTMKIGSKFVHTFAIDTVTTTSTYSLVSSGSAGVGEASLGLSYTQTYTVTSVEGEGKWQVWADNTVQIS